MMDKTTSHFRNLLAETVQKLEKNCSKWEALCTEHSLSEEVLGEIRTAIGLTKLLLNQKLKQFNGLIDDSEFKRSEKEVTCTDLEGFWEMVSFEVEKIQRNFISLEKLKMNNWEVNNEMTDRPAVKKKIARPISKQTVAATKSLAHAARQRIAEAKQKMRQQQLLKQNENELVVEIVKSSNQHHLVNEVISKENAAVKLFQNSEPENKESTQLCSEKEISKSKDTLHSLKEANIEKSVRTTRKSKKDNESDNFGKENKLSVPKSKRSTNVAETDKENASVPFKKVDKKQRDYGKLQCVTRAAAKAMLIENKNH